MQAIFVHLKLNVILQKFPMELNEKIKIKTVAMFNKLKKRQKIDKQMTKNKCGKRQIKANGSRAPLNLLIEIIL